jgi:WD40 repeat protein
VSGVAQAQRIPSPPQGTLVVGCVFNNNTYQSGKIYVDGRESGRCPGVTLRLGTGSHTVRVGEALGNNRYLAYENEQVEILKDGTRKLTATLAPVAGEKAPSLAFALGAKRLSGLPTVDDTKASAFSPDATVVAIGAETNSVMLYHVDDGKALHRLGESGEYWVSFVTALGFSADGSLLASSGWLYDKYTGEINIWDVKSGRLLRTINDMKKVSALAFSPDGKLLAAGVAPGLIEVWSASDGKLLWSVGSPQGNSDGEIDRLIFSADGSLLVTGHAAGESVDIYDALTGKRKRALQGRLMTLGRDGRVITSVTLAGITTQRAWRPATGELIESKQFKYIWTAWGMSEDIWVVDSNGVALRNMRNGQVMLSLGGLFNPLALSADGRRLLFYGDGGYVIWSLPALTSLSSLCSSNAPSGSLLNPSVR